MRGGGEEFVREKNIATIVERLILKISWKEVFDKNCLSRLSGFMLNPLRVLVFHGS